MDLETIITFLGIIFNCLYIYIKILNIHNISKLKIAVAIVFSIIISVLIYLLPSSMTDIRLIIMLVSTSIFINIVARIKFEVMITAIVISYGMSYGFFLFSLTIIAFVLRIITKTINYTLLSILTPILSFLCVIIFFHIKRLKKGFTFLIDNKSGGIGFIISSLVIITVILIGLRDIPDSIARLLFIGAFMCMVGMILWWRYSLTKLYKQRLGEAEILEYKALIAARDEQIKNLNECNYYLSKILHRDNKLVPAMYYAVKYFLDTIIKPSDLEIQTSGSSILNKLDEMMKDRKEIILMNQKEYKKLQSTRIDSIDDILSFMLLQASKKEIQFDFTTTTNVKEIIENIVMKDTLETLIADLIDNAIIATSNSEFKKILMIISIVNDCYEIQIQDSGNPFETEVLINLGVKKTTTHANDGGSGIGYMSIFEILHETGASLLITEHPISKYSFTKSITIRFDGKCEYIICSPRADIRATAYENHLTPTILRA